MPRQLAEEGVLNFSPCAECGVALRPSHKVVLLRVLRNVEQDRSAIHTLQLAVETSPLPLPTYSALTTEAAYLSKRHGLDAELARRLIREHGNNRTAIEKAIADMKR